MDPSTFGYRESYITLFVPDKSITDYKAVDPWNKFKNMTVICDVNKDNDVNAIDIEYLKAIIMGNPPKDVDFLLADVNGDGVVDVADIVEIIKGFKAR